MDMCIYRKSLFLDSLIVLYIVYYDFFKLYYYINGDSIKYFGAP